MNYKFVLIDHESGQETQQWILPLPVVIGRCPTADITIDAASVSRRHCQFLLDPYGSLMARDLGSKNGVYVEERRVDKATVRPGSEVRLGVVCIRCDLTDEEKDEMVAAPETATYDLAETQKVKIVRPEDIT